MGFSNAKGASEGKFFILAERIFARISAPMTSSKRMGRMMMPLFNFECEKCGEQSEFMLRRSEADLTVRKYCEKCKEFSMKRMAVQPINIKSFKGRTPRFHGR